MLMFECLVPRWERFGKDGPVGEGVSEGWALKFQKIPIIPSVSLCPVVLDEGVSSQLFFVPPSWTLTL